MRTKKYDEWIFVSILLLVLFVVFLVIPLVGLLRQSVYNAEGALTWENFERFFTYTNGYYLKPLGNSVKVTVATTLVSEASVALMVAVPSATPVTTPALVTVALSVSREDQVTVWPAGAVVAVRVMVSPTSTLSAPLIMMVSEASAG